MLIDRLDRRWYPGHAHHWDEAFFRKGILQRITRRSRVLDPAAGHGFVRQMYFGVLSARVCGVDLDPCVMNNPFLDHACARNIRKLATASELNVTHSARLLGGPAYLRVHVAISFLNCLYQRVINFSERLLMAELQKTMETDLAHT